MPCAPRAHSPRRTNSERGRHARPERRCFAWTAQHDRTTPHHCHPEPADEGSSLSESTVRVTGCETLPIREHRSSVGLGPDGVSEVVGRARPGRGSVVCTDWARFFGLTRQNDSLIRSRDQMAAWGMTHARPRPRLPFESLRANGEGTAKLVRYGWLARGGSAT
jgi:hypothetical protein